MEEFINIVDFKSSSRQTEVELITYNDDALFSWNLLQDTRSIQNV